MTGESLMHSHETLCSRQGLYTTGVQLTEVDWYTVSQIECARAEVGRACDGALRAVLAWKVFGGL